MIWWLVWPDFRLYRVTPDGERTLFADNVVWDQMSVEVDGEGNVYFTSPEGIYRIYREP